MSSKNQKLNLDKETLIDLYISQRKTSKEIAEIFGCTSKSIRNYLTKYNIPIRQDGEAVALERSKWSDEKEAERTKHYIQTWNSHTDHEKQEINARKTINIHTPETVEKQIASRIANGTSKESKAETEFGQQLQLFLDKNDLIHHYKDERYPYDCDFYIPSKDLFIEYQGHQTHGPAPYDATDQAHWDYADRLQKSGFTTYVFEHKDPEKLATAKQNKINLLLIYPKNDSYLVSNGQVKNIGKFTVTKINELC